MTNVSRIKNRCKRYIRETGAAIAIMFGLMAPLLVAVTGVSIDLAQAYLVKQRLSQALDAAALAGAAAASDEAGIRQRILDFFRANYPESEIGFTFVPSVQVVGDEIFVSGKAVYETMFLRIIGVKFMDVTAKTTVLREVQGLEVVLVLDNTGSMSTNNNISHLKTATSEFINIMFAATSNPNFVRIGMVPYSNSVRIGRYGLGQKPNGSTYADGEKFVTLPSGVNYTTSWSSSSGWYGCVVEHKDTGYNSSATHVSNSYGQLWRSGTSWNGHGWNAASGSNDPYDYDVLDNYEGPWDIYMYGKVISQGQQCSGSGYSSSRCTNCTGYNSTCNSTYCYCRNSRPNQGCPYAYVMPITSDQDALLANVETMQPEGNTLGNIGMAWGARLISPEAPFEEANEWEDPYWKKAIIMMTDGDNTLNGTYSSYWFTSRNDMTVTKFNNRFAETCQALKDKGVTIYTVTFYSGINENTKDYYRECASSEDQYFDAPTTDDLIDVFKRIARELSHLHIKE